jgi:pimeloyl-[acyl-carrier protein] methyl ester esterase
MASERLSKAFGYPLRVHPDAGHDLALDAPDWVIAQLQEFFSA